MSKLRGLAKRKLSADIKRLIGKNYSDEEIMDELEIQPHVLAEYKRQIITLERHAFQNLDSSAVYADYLFKQRQMIKELDLIQTKFRNRGQWTALVAAIKTKSEIYDKSIKLGQDFGFIEKKAGELKVTGEVSFSAMSEADMQKQIKQEVEAMHRMVKSKEIHMREEILGVTGKEVRKFLPTNVKYDPQKEMDDERAESLAIEDQRPRKKLKARVKVTLRKSV